MSHHTAAGCTIVAIVQENSLFTHQVKTWAHRLSTGNEEKRAAVGTWCEINKDALLRNDYAAPGQLSRDLLSGRCYRPPTGW